jgi:nitrate/nitrite transporter NarK
MQRVILLYSAATLAASALTWWLVPVPEYRRRMAPRPLHGMLVVLKQPVVWAQAAIVICAYCGFKGLDNYSLYAVQVLGMDEVAAARFATWGAYLRPVAALVAGILADRFAATRVIAACFLLMLVTSVLLSVLAPGSQANALIMGNLFISFFAVFALRAVYFALLEENRTPLKYTGAAVGLVSLVGFTPEIFFAPVAGRILDATPGLGGHQDYFLLLAVIAAAGIVAVTWLAWLHRRAAGSAWDETGPSKRNP